MSSFKSLITPILATISMALAQGCADGADTGPVVLDLGDVVGVAETGPDGDLAVTLEDATSGREVAAAWWDDDAGVFEWSIGDGVGGEVALDIAPTPVGAIAIVFARYHEALARDEVGYGYAICFWNCVAWTGDVESCALGCDLQN